MAGRSPLKVALLGAGGFVKDAYLSPLAANSGTLLLTAAWSRSERSVTELVQAVHRFSPSCKAYHGDEGLQELLRSADVDACLVVLPPQVQGAVVQAALRAGKHVLSEKPVAPTLAQAEQLLAFHRSLPQPAPIWAVAENYRCMEGLLRLRDTIAAGTLGAVARLDMATDLALHPGAKYFDSQWRRDSETLPGAYLTEGGVHFVAALRMMAGAAGWGQATAAVACARGISDNLPHPDVLQGLVWFESGELRLAVRRGRSLGAVEEASG
jgi:predicted dehydrogenase